MHFQPSFLKTTTPLLLSALLWAACAQEQTQPKGAIDPLTGLDTTRALISSAEIAATDSLLLFPFLQDSLWGFADSSGQVLIEPTYQAVEPFREGLAIVMRDSMYGMIDKKGREILPTKYARVHPSACGVITLRTPGGYVLLGIDGKRLTQEVYDKVYPAACSEGRIPVIQDGKAAFLDLEGHNVTGYQFEEVYPYHHGMAPARSKGKWGMIGMDGRAKVSFRFEALFPMVSGMAVGMEKDATGLERWGVIDSTGKTIIPFQFGQITGSFQGSHVAAAARKPMDLFKAGIPDSMNTWFIFDRQGNVTGETHHHLWDDFSEGLVVAESGGKFGFIDPSARVVIPIEYDWACGFRNGLAWVGKNGRYGFIDPKGRLAIPLRYAPVLDYVYMEDDGALVADPATGERFYIDKHGKEYRKRP